MCIRNIDKCIESDKGYRLQVDYLSVEERKIILDAKRKLGITKPRFYRLAILEKARSVMGTGGL